MLKEFAIEEWRRNEERQLEEKERKHKSEIKNEILTTVAFIAFIAFIISACLLDSKSWIPAVVCVVSAAYLFIFLKVNGLVAKLPRW